ncbi:hypothetical protein Mam01_14050 [Microbispora amethystogenes]|uniref:Uncharacterized protein n=1 Tax=Microbispora amethystogenes TaxID=1427754 RepID=A0ABQ4F8V3_9ACTN|nr:hypothetical protein Mam01_14050 [Microbispora amethystogenes]
MDPFLRKPRVSPYGAATGRAGRRSFAADTWTPSQEKGCGCEMATAAEPVATKQRRPMPDITHKKKGTCQVTET